MNYKTLLKLYPLIGTFLVFMGVVKIHIYYSHFELNIFDYLDFSEILTSFLDDINLFLLGLFLMLIYSVAGSFLIFTFLKKLLGKTRSKAVNSEHLSRYLTIKSFGTATGRIMSVLLQSLTIGVSYWGIFHYQNIILIYVCIMFLLQLISMLLDWLTNMDDDTKTNITLISIVFAFVWLNAQLEINKIETSPSKTTIITNNDTICTSETQFMIGKTDKYLFIHSVSGLNTILPVTQLGSLTIENERKK